jgi:formate dehydrogenase major subunit
MSRWLPWLAELQPEMFCEVSPELAAEKFLKNGGWATVTSARAAIEVRVLVTRRILPLRIGDKLVQQIGLPYHWGRNGLVRGDAANELIPLSADANVSIFNSKAHTCNIYPGRIARRLRPKHLFLEGARPVGVDLRDLPAARHRPIGRHGVAAARDKQGDQT